MGDIMLKVFLGASCVAKSQNCGTFATGFKNRTNTGIKQVTLVIFTLTFFIVGPGDAKDLSFTD